MGVGIVLVLGAAGCGPSQEPATTSSSQTPASQPPTEGGEAAASAASAATEAPTRSDLQQHMQRSFWDAVDARDAVIVADLRGAQEAGRRLDALEVAAFPADWRHWVQNLRMHASELQMAPDLETAGAAVGALGRTCGQCHWHLSQGPKADRPEDEDMATDGPDELDDRMLRHAVGVDEMWLGLVKPSHKLWRQGTVTLTRAPLKPPTEQGEAVPPALAEGVEAMRELARGARAARTLDERASTYGALISRCGHCHTHPPARR